MNQQIRNCMIAGILSFFSVTAFGQNEQNEDPAWVSPNGYWVVESNKMTPLEHSIRFYNNQHVLVGRKDLSGVRLNFKRKKVKMMLREALESSLVAWEKEGDATQKTQWAKAKP